MSFAIQLLSGCTLLVFVLALVVWVVSPVLY